MTSVRVLAALGALLGLLGILTLSSWPAIAQLPEDERYQEIIVDIPPGGTAAEILAISPDLEIIGRGERDLSLVSRPRHTEELIRLGWRVAVVHDDLEGYYSSRSPLPADYGVWHDYEEAVQELHDLHRDFPEITTAPFVIGNSVESREILGIKISDNPDVDEDEPEVLYDGIHHAREIMSLELNLYVARYFCENYGSDPLVTEIVDGREIFVVPIVNPDGFVYNQERQPSGGGMWRKNRRSGAGCFGVDLNRNYPLEWGGSGSSGNSCDETYRGPAPASEPEVRAMMDFIGGRRFVTHDSIHSVAGMILFPWGYTDSPSPDDDALRMVASERASRNAYVIGQAPEILYKVDGDINDWAYGDETQRPKIYSFTTEVGGTGFWPSPSEREGLLLENLYSMIYLAKVAGRSARIQDVRVYEPGGEGRIDAGEPVQLVPVLLQDGLAPYEDGLRLRLRTDDPYVLLLDATSSASDLRYQAPLENSADPLAIRLADDCPHGRVVTLEMEMRDPARDGDALAILPLEYTVGVPEGIAINEFETDGDAWTIDPTSTATSGAFVRADPNGTDFQPEDDAGAGTHAWITGQNDSVDRDDVDGGEWISNSPEFDLTCCENVRLTLRYFFGQRDSGDDPAGDYFVFEGRDDPSAAWIPLLAIGDQASSPEWRQLQVDLQDVMSLTAHVAFRVRIADGPAAGDIIEGGIDDFFLAEPEGPGGLPTAPQPVSPQDSASAVSPWPTLTVANSAPGGGEGPLTYGFRIFGDPELTRVVVETGGVVEGERGITSWTVSGSPLPVGSYYWRAYAERAGVKGPYGPTRTFTITEEADTRPGLFAYPNPAWRESRLRIRMPETLTSQLAIYDAAGRKVRQLQNPSSAGGWTEVAWDGRDDQGRTLPQGNYWVRLWTPRETRTLRLTRIAEDNDDPGARPHRLRPDSRRDN